MLGKIELRGSLEAVHAAAEIDLVPVEGKNLLLGEGAFDLDGEVGLLDLAQGGAVGGKEEIARQLHGESGGPLRPSMRAQIVNQGSEDAEKVDAAMGHECLVLNGDDSLPQDRGKVVVIDDDAALQGERTDDAPLLVVEVGGSGGAIALQIMNLGEVD